MASDVDFNKFVEELKEKTDIVRIIGSYVQLERKGKFFWGRCPFHGEKTPSFIVNDISRSYYCFGCKAYGDVITFIEQIESLDFMGALNVLAEKANLTLPTFSSKPNGNQDDIVNRKKYKDRLLQLTKDTAKHYLNNLFTGKCPDAWQYLQKRQVPIELAKQFGLGASKNYDDICLHLASLGYTNKEMLDAGVVKSRNGKIYDAVAGRLIFPLIDIMGNVIGFCGRLLKNANFAKYLNTADTMLFSKGKTLYGINLVKKRKNEDAKNPIKYMIIVEGQMDVVSLHKAGFNTAVASMGTALTIDQARLIKRFCDNVFICYDGDFAGKKATIKGLEILKDEGLNVKVMNLPEGYDPDDVICKLGKEKFVELMKEAMPLLDFKLDLVRKQYDLNSREGKTKYINDALSILKEVPEVEREIYLGLVSEVSGTNKDFLKRQIAGIEPLKNENLAINNVKTREVVKTIDNAIIKAQKFILSCMINLKPFAYFENDINYIFNGEQYIEICKAIESARGSVSNEQMLARCKQYLGGHFEQELNEIINYCYAFGDENESRYFKDCIWTVYKEYLENKLELLNQELAKEIDNEKRKQKLVEIAKIVNAIKQKKVEL